MSKEKKAEGEISLKNTKNEIFQAYEEALKDLKAKGSQDQSQVQERLKRQEKLEKISQFSPPEILKNLDALKYSLGEEVAHLRNQLEKEFETLDDLRSVIISEQKHLADLYQIKEEAQTLAALLFSQQKTRETFEEKMALDEALWEKKRRALEEAYQERQALLAKTQAREEEEYAYTLKKEREKEKDAYEAQKAALEKDLQQRTAHLESRETSLKSREDEMRLLEAKVAQFPDVLKQALAESENALKERLERDHHHAQDLKEQEVSGKMALKDQKIAALEQKIKEQNALIESLTRKAEKAIEQVESIARQALNVSSSRFGVLKETPIDSSKP